ncbi:MFS transporter [Peribacillus frigoritolerans]|uniref:MFS transporter n=2 Tax=Peribacillus frigoritolerans TaxID=450367 RepID=UPI00202B5A52|nr:MFS transporter [Peribacillus frigoritolerans]
MKVSNTAVKTDNISNKKEMTGLPFVILITCITALGGFLFGFDNGSISGAIGFLENHFNLTPLSIGWVTSSLMVGCFIGTIIAGKLGDLLGRKKVLLICAFLFALSSAGMAFSSTVSFLVIMRIGLGIAIGMEITLAPLYIAEISPAKIRGRLVSFNQLLNCVGNLAIFSVSAIVANTHTQEWNNEYAWRWIFGLGVIPSLIFFILLFLVPESPRWLLQKNKNKQALYVLEKINGSTAAKNILNEMQQTIGKDKGKYSDLLHPSLRKGLTIAIIIAFAQQITGINAVIYYAPEIFKSAGAGSNAALLSTVMVGVD